MHFDGGRHVHRGGGRRFGSLGCLLGLLQGWDGLVDRLLELLGHVDQTRLHVLQMLDEVLPAGREPHQNAVGLLLCLLQQLVALLPRLLGARLRVHPDAICFGSRLVQHAGGVGPAFGQDPLGLLIGRGEERGQTLGEAFVGIVGWRWAGRRDGRTGRAFGCPVVQPRFAQLALESFDLLGDLRQIVTDLIGIVAPSDGRELTATDLGCARKER